MYKSRGGSRDTSIGKIEVPSTGHIATVPTRRVKLWAPPGTPSLAKPIGTHNIIVNGIVAIAYTSRGRAYNNTGILPNWLVTNRRRKGAANNKGDIAPARNPREMSNT